MRKVRAGAHVKNKMSDTDNMAAKLLFLKATVLFVDKTAYYWREK